MDKPDINVDAAGGHRSLRNADPAVSGDASGEEGGSADGGGAESAVGKFRLRRALYPVLIGLGVVGYMFWRDFEPAVFSDIAFSWMSVFWLLVAFLCMFGRDLGYIVRLRILKIGRAHV